jgi:BirA family biotin operon repressor/biotin-[acetyl-CoA-carboxylase] ligase
MIEGEDAGAERLPADLHPARILGMLDTARFGRTIILFDSAGSTNTEAAAAADVLEEGTVIIAAEQVTGRGRKGRSWFTGTGGGLAFSLIVKPAQASGSLTALLAISAAAALEDEYPGIEVGIKWPNDLYIGPGKVAGILAETRGGSVILGMGLNVNDEPGAFPPAIADMAVSLRMAGAMARCRGEILAAIIRRFEDLYTRWEGGEPDLLRSRLESRLLWKGERVSIENGMETVSGVVEGVTAEGYLRLSTAGGPRVFHAGDLSLRREER